MLAQTNPSEELARLHFFSMKKKQENCDVEFRITVREYATFREPGLQYFAEADRQTNQGTAPFTPCGWGNTLFTALNECIAAIHRFPYEGPMPE
jgi:hypothetical protein